MAAALRQVLQRMVRQSSASCCSVIVRSVGQKGSNVSLLAAISSHPALGGVVYFDIRTGGTTVRFLWSSFSACVTRFGIKTLICAFKL